MFIHQIQKRNPHFIEAVFDLYQKGLIRPDSYVLDVDTIIENAKKIKTCADNNGIKLYFMLKQIGRNPYIAQKLIDLGFEASVSVDYKEAQIYIENNIPLGNVGHLVQIPNAEIEKVILSRPQVITVYSYEKIKLINDICFKLGLKQNILLRVYDDESVFYEGQEGGFHISEIEKLLQQIKEFGNINISGATAFPAMICKNDKIEATQNAFAVLKAIEILKKNGIEIKQINLPSATCCQSIPKLKNLGATHGEPGHALTGTTPLHAISDQPEIPAAVYVSEISHNYKDNAYCFGGGYYRRSNIKNALVGKNAKSFNRTEVFPPQIDSIDYHFKLAGRQNIGDIVIMAFRFQAFVTRSDIVLIENIHSGRQIKIAGIYDSLGRQL